jgi:hypothetical protein
MTSYIKILQKLDAFCTAHLQIKKFMGEFREQMPNFSTMDERYPIVFATPVSDVEDLNTNQFTLEIYCVDIIQKDRANLNTIVSDCHLILKDMFIYYRDDNDTDLDVVGTASISFVNNFDLDYVAGAVMTITFEVAGYTWCEIPMNPIIPVTNECEPATLVVKDSEDNILYTLVVDSGATDTQIIADSTYLVEYENGTPIESGSILAEGSAVIQVPNPIVCEDATVENSDASYTDTVASGGSLVLPDSTVNVNSVNEGSVVSVNTVEINVTDGTDPVTPGSVSVVGNTVTIEVTTGSALDSDAEAFLLATSITDATITTAVNDLVVGLKTNYLWNKMRALYPFVGGTASTHKFNLKDPRDLDAAYRLTFFGGITHSSTGADPNGTTGYANTHIYPNYFGLSDIHLSFYSRENTHSGGDNFDIGTVTGAVNRFWLSSGLSNTNSPTSGLGGVLASSSGSTDGFFAGSLTGTALINNTNKLYKNGSLLATSVSTMSITNNASIALFRANGIDSGYSDRECAFASIGFGLSDSDVTALNTLVQAFQTTLSRNV